MNKIKIIYDTVKNMKDKDFIKGELKAEIIKDQLKVFDITNTFEKNKQTHDTKCQSSMSIDCDEKKIKLENNINFEMKGCHGHEHHNFIRNIHSFHKHHHEPHSGGIKEGLDKLTIVLGLLSSIKLDEKTDDSVVLTLESNNIPKEIKAVIDEKIKHGCDHHKHMSEHHKGVDVQHHHLFMKEFCSMESSDFTLNVFINKDRELEKIIVNVNGKKKDEKNEEHDMKFTAELNIKGIHSQSQQHSC